MQVHTLAYTCALSIVVERLGERIGSGGWLTVPARTGEEETKALYQPHSLRELHISGRSGCLRQSYAEYEGTFWIERGEKYR